MNNLSSGITGGRRGSSFAVNVLFISALLVFCGSLFSASAQTADFSASRTALCPGNYVTYTNLSTWPAGAGRTFAWSFPGGFPNADTSRSLLVYYATPGVYTVSLTTCSDGTCDTETRNAYITVHTPPNASLTWSIPDACQSLGVQFNSTSVAGSSAIASYFWDFDNGTGSALPSPLQTFSAAGTYEVILLVTDANGCQSDLEVPVTVLPGLSASATITPPMACGAGPLNVTLSGSVSGGTGPYSYSWDYGNGSGGSGQIANALYNGCGEYDVELTVEDGNNCSVSVTYDEAVQLFCPLIDFTLSADSICVGEPLIALDASVPSTGTHSWLFDITDPLSAATGANVAYQYNAPGNYTIQHCVAYGGGCVECSTQEVVVRNKPLAANILVSQNNSCSLPFSPTLTADGVTGTAPFDYQWVIGSATYSGPSITPTFTLPGLYNVVLIVTDASGCTDTLIRPNLIRIRAAVAGFTMDNSFGCSPVEVNFTNTSFSPLVPIDSFVWNLGDGTSFSVTNQDSFSHVYTAVGDYPVSLIAYTALGCTDTANALVQVGEVNADFDLVRDTTCSTADLLNFTQNADYTIVYWGNGDSTVLPDPLGDYTYFYYGITDTVRYTITMVAYFNGCSEVVTHDILVSPPFGFDRSLTRDCSDPYTVTLWVDPAVLDGGFCWDIGSGDTLCDINPVTITFPAEGLYTVYIRDPGNPLFDTTCILDYFEVAIINSVPSFVADDLSGCQTLTTYFSNTNNDPVFDDMVYRWEIGPSLVHGITYSAIATTDAWAYYFAVPDIYPIRMTPLDSSLCNVGYTAEAVVSDPTAVFFIDSLRGCDPTTAYFRDSSYAVTADPRMAIVHRAWSFDNDAVCPPFMGLTPPSCSYNPGSYNVHLRVRDAQGCLSLSTQTLNIAPNDVEAGFYFDTPVCGNDTTYFYNGSTGSNGVASYYWEFADGATYTEAEPRHVFPGSGTYAVRLTVTDSAGCSDPLTRQVTVEMGDVVPDFTVTYFSVGVCPPIPVQLTNTSTGSVASVEWFVETATGVNYYTGNSAIHTYTRAGVYDITMVVTDTRGCTDTLTRSDNVTITGPTGDLTIAPTSGCAPLEVFFDLENIRADQVFIDFGNGDTLQVYDDFYFVYDEPGVYCPRMILLDSLGCETQYNCPGPITVLDRPEAVLSLSDLLICDDNLVWLRNESNLDSLMSPVLSTFVDFGDGSSTTFVGSFDSISHNYPLSGFYTVRMVLENAGGCTDTAEAVLAVGEVPTGAFSISPAAGCGALTVSFNLSGVFADSAFIDFGDGVQLYADSSLDYTYTQPGVYVPRMILRNNTGCSSIIVNGDPVLVAHAPVADLHVPVTGHCFGESFELINQSVDTVGNPLINAIDFLELYVEGDLLASGSSLGSTNYTPFAPGDYTVMLIAGNDQGCADTTTVVVSAYGLPVAAYDLTPAAGCAPVEASVVLYSIQADSAFVDFGDGTVMFTDSAASHTYLVPGIYYPRVILRDTTGCNNIIANGDPIQVAYAPVANLGLSAQGLCLGESFALINQSVDTVSSPLINAIDFLELYVNGDLLASGSSLGSTEFIPPTAGDYTVMLIAGNDQGCLDTATAVLSAYGLPMAEYALTPAAGCAPVEAMITLSSLLADSAFVDFGDGTLLYTNSAASHVYTVPGVYYPRLFLRDSTGCSNIIANGDPVTVGYAPQAVLDVPEVSLCHGQQFTFINMSEDTVSNPLINPIDLLELYVEGLLIASGPPMNTVLFSPASSGEYTVMLVASNDLGCVDTARVVINSNPAPRGDYSLSGALGCVPLNLNVELHDLLADSAWLDFGDGTVMLLSSGSADYLYTVPGIYEPRLILQDNNGCSLLVEHGDPVTAAFRPEARLAVPDTSQCSQQEFTFINESVDMGSHPSINAIDELRLYFDGVLLAAGPVLDTVYFTENNAGDFAVELIALNDLGCVDTALQRVVVHPVPLAQAAADVEVCQGADIQLDGSGSLGASFFSWSPAALVSNPAAAQTTAVAANNQTFVLTVSTGFCDASDSVSVRVIQDLGLIPGPDAAICPGEAVPLSAEVETNVPGVSWIWTPASSLSDPTSLTPVAFVNGDAAYTITATCGTLEEAATIFIDVLPPPVVEASTDTALMILGTSVQLQALGFGGTGELEYWWDQRADLSCTDCPNPMATPLNSGWYVVNVVDEAGCTSLDSVFLRVYTDCLGSDFQIGKAFTPNGDGNNDLFEFRSETIQNLELFRVWNRWGEMVFETSEGGQFWDGTQRGQPLNPGVFAYTIQGVCINGENFLRTGDITLIR